MAEKNKNNLQATTEAENYCSCFLLPPDIIADILSRLPAKSIAKLRCVCKQWLSLTHDSYILKSVHERSSRIIIENFSADGEIKSHNFSSGSDGKGSSQSSYTLNLARGTYWLSGEYFAQIGYMHILGGRGMYRLSNFVNGLTCAYVSGCSSNIYLLNPTTQELEKLPKMTNNHQEVCIRENFEYQSVGLGMDMTTGEYKVVTLFQFLENNRLQCEIYSTGTRQWRCIDAPPFEFHNNLIQVLHHGALHCIGYHRGSAKISIFRFNIEEEKFGSAAVIPYPVVFHPLLRESGGKLWLILKKYWKSYYFEIWTMEDYLNNTWVKTFIVNSSSILSSVHDIYATDVVDGDVILKTCDEQLKWHVMLYNPRIGVSRKLCDGEDTVDYVVCRESLISPKKLLKISPKDM